jgi:hypothetical protein
VRDDEHVAIHVRARDVLHDVRHALGECDRGFAAGGWIPRRIGAPTLVLVVPLARDDIRGQPVPIAVVDLGKIIPALHGQPEPLSKRCRRRDGARERARVDGCPLVVHIGIRKCSRHRESFVRERRIETATAEDIRPAHCRLAMAQQVEA